MSVESILTTHSRPLIAEDDVGELARCIRL